jgi:aromatic ring-opening dioxygenase catalytic subunit (LigB family)
MATVVGSIGLSHNPTYPALIAKNGPDYAPGLAYARLRQEFADLKPDAIVIFDTDHLNTFFLDNLPIFAIGVDDSFAGPCDEVPLVPHYTAPSHRAFASHLRSEAVAAGFDLALVQHFEADHSVFVPLHFLMPEMHVPVIPIFISGHNHFAQGHMSPMPSARRCFELGRTVRTAIERWPEPIRIVTIGSGAISLDVHGTKIAPGVFVGVPDPSWVERVHQHLERSSIADLVDETTPARLRSAGNVSGEILNWIAMLGSANRGAPVWSKTLPDEGFIYAAWH